MRSTLKDKKRIVIKIGTSTITHEKTGNLNLDKMEKLIRVLTDLRNQGKEIILVSSGAIGQGRAALGLKEKPSDTALKQACAAIGQGRLMMIYEKLFAEYNQIPAQVLITKDTMVYDVSRVNAQNTFRELLQLGVIPIVNENDTVATEELMYGDFGDNDTLSAIVSALVGADLLILLSDIDGLYTDDPHSNKDAEFIELVERIDDRLFQMGKDTKGSMGTGGMATKLSAAKIATDSGADMVIANGENVAVINEIIQGKNLGTLFLAHKSEDFDLMDYIMNSHK
ncbi:glutamate 5-kinase [Anaerolentibacter hominis]|uniref:glutamate 5-kinase n=1 Tax=Anaerolentibacter hominis TaxID=3079009 RepID=UPI0031B7EE05